MPDARGGRRVPDNKARPVAGPGKLSQRTDLSQPPPGQGSYVPSGMQYGQRQRLEQAQQVAPAPALRQGPPAPPPPGRPGQPQAAGGQIPSLAQILARPTDRPDEPPTAGLPGGAGPGPEVLPFDTPFGQGNMTPTLADIERMRKALPGLEALADLPDTSDTFRTYVRTLRGQAGNV
jgi:hypothetical protein